jgi:hypothetical protein
VAENKLKQDEITAVLAFQEFLSTVLAQMLVLLNAYSSS